MSSVTPSHRGVYEHVEGIRPSPGSLSERIKALGPGVILSGSVVGSGELIGVANFGATVGFVAMWIIIGWIVLKMFVAMELARFTIVTQKTALEAWSDDVPGPKIRGIGWMAWVAILLIAFVAIFGIGGVLGGQISFMLAIFPAFTGDTAIWTWTVIFMVVTFLLLASAAYERVEAITVALVAIFSITVLLSVFLLQGTRFAFSAGEFFSGLTFQLPQGAGYVLALSLGGLIGFAPAELIFYSYWSKEKGYGAWTGPYEDTPEWHARSRGWIRMMQIDVLVSSLITGVITIAFYLLGAAVLFRMQQNPAGMTLATTLAQQFTQLYGGWAAWVYLLGGFAALYSTYFVWTGSGARFFADAMDILGIAHLNSREEWAKWVRIWVGGVLLFITFGNFVVKDPVINITFNGVVGALLFPVVSLSIMVLAYKVPRSVRAGTAFMVVLWIASIVMTAYALYSLLKLAGVPV